MRKIRLGIAAVICIAATSQACTVNTTSPQVSKGVQDSKDNGFFIAELYAESSYDSLVVEEAWVEKMWFNDRQGIGYTKTSTDACQLCFKVKQVPGARFMLDSPLRWIIREKSTGNYVGVKARNTSKGLTGTYTYEMQSCTIPDSIEFDLLFNPEAQVTDPVSDDNVSAGRLVFKKR